MRALAFLPLAFSVAIAFGLMASCDTGGEPPPPPDGGAPEVAATDTRIDNYRPPVDSSPGDTSSDGPTGDGACGTMDNACCTGAEVAPCGKGTSCTFGICQGTCGHPGETCCKGHECLGSGTVCNSHDICTSCGGSGEACCALNECSSGGCCVGDICSPEGTKCANTDGGVCMSGGCGTCGSPGQPCCPSGCTAPRTVCQGAIAGFDAGEAGTTGGSSGECAGCGGAGQPCCSGSSCESDLSCNSGICVCPPKGCGGGGG